MLSSTYLNRCCLYGGVIPAPAKILTTSPASKPEYEQHKNGRGYQTAKCNAYDSPTGESICGAMCRAYAIVVTAFASTALRVIRAGIARFSADAVCTAGLRGVVAISCVRTVCSCCCAKETEEKNERCLCLRHRGSLVFQCFILHVLSVVVYSMKGWRAGLAHVQVRYSSVSVPLRWVASYLGVSKKSCALVTCEMFHHCYFETKTLQKPYPLEPSRPVSLT